MKVSPSDPPKPPQEAGWSDSDRSKEHLNNPNAAVSNQNFEEEKKEDYIKTNSVHNDQPEPQTKAVMQENEQELEALIYDDGLAPSENDSLEDELLDEVESIEQDAQPPSLAMADKNYSKTFMRQVSMLKNKRMQKNKINHMDTYVRDADNGLSFSRLQKRVERAHPRRLVNGKLEKYPIFGTNTGWNLPSKGLRKSDLKELGVGISIYFKFLKYLICIFGVVSLLSIPALMFYISASDGNYKANPSFETALALTTIGNMGTVTASCAKASNLLSSVDFFCTYGTLKGVTEVGTIIEGNPDSSCKNDGAFLVTDAACSILAGSIDTTVMAEIRTTFDQNCTQQRVCSMDMSGISWPSNCDTTVTAFVKAECETETVLGTDKETVGYIIVSFDILIIFFLWIAFQIHGTYEDLEEKEVEGNVLDGEDFTVEVANIPEHSDYRILKIQMWKHIETVLKEHPEYAVAEENDVNSHKIAQCNMALKKYVILHYFKQRLKFEKQDRIYALKLALLHKSKATPEKIEKLREKFTAKRDAIKVKYDKNEEKIKELRSKGSANAVKIFITMQSMEGRERVKKAFQHNKKRRCCKLVTDDDRVIQGKWLTVTNARKASILLWENLAVPKFERFMRVLAISLFSCLLIIVTFVLLILMKSEQRTLTNDYNASTCPGASISQQEALRDYNLPAEDRTGLMHCYCLNVYNNNGAGVRNTVFSDGGKHCSSWYTSFALATALIYIISFVMTNINVAIKVILRLASRYEKREDKTEEVISNTFKMFVTQIINTIIILLVVNFKLGFMPSWFPVFAGDYDDFTSQWYSEVGTAILLTMFLSIFGPHLANAMFHAMFALQRCIDRGCRCNPRKTKRLFQIDYEALYIGPEYMMEYRYSQLLTMVYIALIFGAGMPIVYPILVLTFFVTYWVDKFTVLRIYRKPPRYGKVLTKVTREWLNLAIFLHFIFTFVMFSNSAIFDTDDQDLFGWGVSNSEAQVRDDYSIFKVNDKISQYHCFAYALAFGLFVLCFIFKTIFFNVLYKTICQCCRKDKLKVQRDLEKMKVEKDAAYSNNFFKNLETEHLERIIEKTKTEKEVFEDLLSNPRHQVAYSAVRGDIQWYVDRISHMIEEMEEVHGKNKLEKDAQQETNDEKLYIHDHTYDIREIRPYCDFIVDEDLLKRDDISESQSAHEEGISPTIGKINEEAKDESPRMGSDSETPGLLKNQS